jgi:hypothetical protein
MIDHKRANNARLRWPRSRSIEGLPRLPDACPRSPHQRATVRFPTETTWRIRARRAPYTPAAQTGAQEEVLHD